MKYNTAAMVAFCVLAFCGGRTPADAASYTATPIDDFRVASVARCVNDKGQVIGVTTVVDKVHGVCLRAAVWDRENGISALGTLGGRICSPGAINNTGVVVGAADTTFIDPNTDHAIQHACIWYPGKKPIDLSPPKSRLSSSAVALNEGGVVAGYYDDKPAVFRSGKDPLILPAPDCYRGVPFSTIIAHVSPDGTVLAWAFHVKNADLPDVPTSMHLIRWSPDGKTVDDLGQTPHIFPQPLTGMGGTDEPSGMAQPGDINSSLMAVGYRHHYSDAAYKAGYDPDLPGADPAELSPQPVFWEPSMEMDAILNYPRPAKLRWIGMDSLTGLMPSLFTQRACINDQGMIVAAVPDRVMPLPPQRPLPPIVDKLRKEGKEVIVEQEQPETVKGTLYLWPKAGSMPVDLSAQTGVWLTNVFGISDNGTIVAGSSAYVWNGSRLAGSHSSMTTLRTTGVAGIPFLLVPSVAAPDAPGAEPGQPSTDGETGPQFVPVN